MIIDATTLRTNIESDLVRDEGDRLMAYKDSRGRWTIGIGHCLEPVGAFVLAVLNAGGLLTITQAQADALFAVDVSTAIGSLTLALAWVHALNAARQGVLVEMVFNMGIHGVLDFGKMLACCKVGDWAGAAAELRDSTADGQEHARVERWATTMEAGV